MDNDIINWFFQGLAWEFLTRIAAISGLLDLLGFVTARLAFGWKPTKTQSASFLIGGGLTVLLMLLALTAANQQAPRLKAEVLTMAWGGGTDNGVFRNTALLGIGIINQGNMPTVVRNYQLIAKMGADYYDSTPYRIPKIATFSSADGDTLT